MPKTEYTNRLIDETSPYLLQHAHNPVDWYPWGEEALSKARAEDKPIFLSIGYSACHWCHVMERESFEDEETAEVMNRLFVSIKVDREERPDLDAIYMEAVQLTTGHGGWPMSVFLTPEGEPFYAGTYFPPEPRYGMPSFRQVLEAVAEAYRNRRDEVRTEAGKLVQALRRNAELEAGEDQLDGSILDGAVAQLRRSFDNAHGGFGRQPKFPQPMTLDFLLGAYTGTRREELLRMVDLTLEKMAHGGIYDQLGGGFHRYSVDAVWLVPHFEKMLYDNAQLLLTYLHAWQVGQRPLFRRVVEQTLDYVLREMTSPEGGFYSAQDADSEGVEGKFYVWTAAEIDEALGAEAARLFKAHYGVTDEGNFEGANILHVVRSPQDVARDFGVAPDEVARAIAEGRRKLMALREERVRPGRDEKVLVEWNGLMVHALAECGAVLGHAEALAAAGKAADFILGRMRRPDGGLYRTYKDGRAHINAYLEDYASLARALLALYEATFEWRWLEEARSLVAIMTEQFGDHALSPTGKSGGGFYQTGSDHEQLIVRRKDLVESALPSGNSLAADTLLRLSALTGEECYREQAVRVFLLAGEHLRRQPTAFCRLLSALDMYLGPSREIAVVGDPEGDAAPLLREIRARYLPNAVLALRRPAEEARLPILEGREPVNGRAAVYVCRDRVCGLPVTTAEELAVVL